MMQRRKVLREDHIPYLIWSYDYSHASAGPKALHRLCHELNEAGQQAYVGPWITNPEWNTPTSDHEALRGDWIAVYPEIVKGNPWNAPHVARWVLNVPGKLGGDATYATSEMVFTWSTQFIDAPLLHVPTIETDIYYDRGLPRSGSLFYVGKGSGSRSDATEITHEMRLDRERLADALNRAEVLYSFDDTTGMTSIAQLCGCPVVIVPTGQRLEPGGVRESYFAHATIDFPAQLARFIEITQGALVPA